MEPPFPESPFLKLPKYDQPEKKTLLKKFQKSARAAILVGTAGTLAAMAAPAIFVYKMLEPADAKPRNLFAFEILPGMPPFFSETSPAGGGGLGGFPGFDDIQDMIDPDWNLYKKEHREEYGPDQ